MMATLALTLGIMDPVMASVDRPHKVGAGTVQTVQASSQMPPPPADYEAKQFELISREYDAALAAGTIEALEAFIERFPGHELARAAQREIARRKAE